MSAQENCTYLIRPSELSLKGGNRKFFEKLLLKNLRALLKGSDAQIIDRNGRIFVQCKPESEEKVKDSINRLIGISGWAKTITTEKTQDAIISACISEGKSLAKKNIGSFKIEARRTDKSFPIDSYKICCLAGEAIISECPSLKVNVKKPEAVIQVEVREKAYIYGGLNEGRRGLPVSSAGKGLLLLSGGIDSPVAGYLMAARGMYLEAVYFHSWPYTSDEAKKKSIKLAEIIGQYSQGIRLSIISFTELMGRIRERSPEPWRTVLLRMAMMECAEHLAKKRKCKCLINGESLSQVASQTIENISCTQSRVTIPVLQPLIGMNKDEIIRLSEKIGTYKTSILPYEDCCTIFSPPHPIIRGDKKEAEKLYEELDTDQLIRDALDSLETEYCSFP